MTTELQSHPEDCNDHWAFLTGKSVLPLEGWEGVVPFDYRVTKSPEDVGSPPGLLAAETV